jgi:2-keto-4-pentenoate hydratase
VDSAAIADLIGSARTRETTLVADQVAVPDSLAYEIQWINTQKRLDSGEEIIGWKLGYVSEVMRLSMGITEPNYAPLFAESFLQSGSTLPGGLIAPRVEPEIAVVLDQNLDPEKYYLSLEVVDSIWRDYNFTWALNTADQSSSAFAVLGPDLLNPALNRRVSQEELFGLIATMEFGLSGGEPVLWDPKSTDINIAASIDWLRESLLRTPRQLRPGDVVLTGGLCAPIPLMAGHSIQSVLTMKDSSPSSGSSPHRVVISRER